MKKLILLFVLAFSLVSCDVEDDGPTFEHVLVEVTDADLPEFFELGKTYSVKVTYVLPDACHRPLGLQVSRGALSGAERRDIYVAAVASRNPELTQCNEQDDDLEHDATFSITIDENQPFTFYLWTGLDDDGENIFTEVVVPVQEATTGGS